MATVAAARATLLRFAVIIDVESRAESSMRILREVLGWKGEVQHAHTNYNKDKAPLAPEVLSRLERGLEADSAVYDFAIHMLDEHASTLQR